MGQRHHQAQGGVDQLQELRGPAGVAAAESRGGRAMSSPMTSMAAMRSFRRDPKVISRELPKGTVKRVLGIARPYRRDLTCPQSTKKSQLIPSAAQGRSAPAGPP